MIVHTPTRSLVIDAKPDIKAKIAEVFPDYYKEITIPGHNLAVAHKLPIVRMLRNMGVMAPSPVRYYYDWPRPPEFTSVFSHQYDTVEFLTLHYKCFVLNEQGTSKSACVVWAADYMMRIKSIKKVLIVAPLSTLELVWLKEIFAVAMNRRAAVLYGSKEKRLKRLASDVDFYIINPAGLNILKKEIMARDDIDTIVVDEAADYRNAQTESYAVLKEVTARRRLWLLTGTPCPNAPTDAWALARLVNPNTVPPYFSQFKRQTMDQITTYKWVPKVGSHEMAFKAMQPAIRFRKKDCLSLPPVTYLDRVCDLSKEQSLAYEDMRKHLVTTVSTETLTAVNAADKIGKLRQILCGAIKTGEDTYKVIDHGPRLKLLQECIEQAGAKVLIIVPFKGITYAIADEINEWYKGRGHGHRCDVVNGDVSITKRNAIFSAFKEDPNLMTLVCHPKVMSHGLTLTEADVMVFYAPIYSNDQYGQVMARIDRPGQTRKMTIVRIRANSLEDAIYKMLAKRQENQENILDLYRQEVTKKYSRSTVDTF